jgi:hypothetical protein
MRKQFENGLCNMEMVELETLEDDDLVKLRRLLEIILCILIAIAKKDFGRLGKPNKTFCQSNADRL